MVEIQELQKLAKRYGYNTRLWQVIEKIADEEEKKDKPKTKFTYGDYLKMSKEQQDNIGSKEWHDLSPEERMLILDDWGFGDDIKEFREHI